MKRIAAALLACILWIGLTAYAAADKVITLSFTGDCTLGGEEKTRNSAASIESYIKEKGYGYFFADFAGLFSQDDCTVVNCEFVFQDTDNKKNTNRSIWYRAGEDAVNIFKEGSVEAASLANSHIADYGEQGLKNTERVLEEAGIGWAREEDFWIYEKDGIRIAFAAIDYGIFQRANYLIRDKLLAMRENGEINAAVLLVHQGKEYAASHTPEQEEYAEYFIEGAKADLVIEHHPHVLQGIRILNNRTVFYSLGSFIFGGSSQITRGKKTNSLYTMAVQVKMHFTDDGVYCGQQAFLYPAYGSSTDPANNYQPVRVSAEEAEPVLEAIQYDTEFDLPEIQTDENGKAVVILNYLPAETPAEELAAGAPEAAQPEPSRDDR